MFTITKRKMSPIDSFLDSEFFNKPSINSVFKDLGVSSSYVKSNVVKKEGHQELQMSLPGIDKSLIDISINELTLTVSYESESEKNEDSESFYLREFMVDSFSRSFKLPKDSDLDKITSRYKNGILYIKVPSDNSEKFKKRTVEVK